MTIRARHFGQTAAVALVLYGCGSAAEVSVDGEDGGDLVADRTTIHRSDRLEQPYRSAVVNDLLVVSDRTADRPLHVFDRHTGAFLGSLGHRGGGPGEFETVFALDPEPEQDAIRVFDVRLNRLTRVTLSQPSPTYTSTQLSSKTVLFGPVVTDQGTYLSLGFFWDGARLAVLSEDGTVVDHVATLPPGGEQVAVAVRHQAYHAVLVAHPDRDATAAVNRRTDLLEIYRSDGTLVNRTRGPAQIDPSFTTSRSGRYAMPQDTPFAYVDVTASRRRIFALFSGRTYGDYGADAVFGTSVHVFGWDGHLKGVIPLSEPTLAVAVDPAGTTLYAVEYRPEPAVTAYTLIDWDDPPRTKAPFTADSD